MQLLEEEKAIYGYIDEYHLKKLEALFHSLLDDLIAIGEINNADSNSQSLLKTEHQSKQLKVFSGLKHNIDNLRQQFYANKQTELLIYTQANSLNDFIESIMEVSGIDTKSYNQLFINCIYGEEQSL